MVMVIMDLIRGLNARHKFLSSELPPIVFEDVRRAIDILDDAWLVFGDLRRPNIIVIGSGEKLQVDFDWARPAGTATYPPEMNNAFVLKWPYEVEPGAKIKKGHDLETLDSLQDRRKLPRS